MSMSDGITVELMQQMLREAEKDNSIVVLDPVQIDELNKDLHAGSCAYRVKVTYTRHGKTSQQYLSLIIKTLPNTNFSPDIVAQSTIFPREIQMYDNILPKMSGLLSRALSEHHTNFSARGYYTRKTPSYLIALEDLAPKGFTASKRNDGLDLDHCLMTFRTLARFHAASVMIKEEDESELAIFDGHLFQEAGTEEVMKTMTDRIVSALTKAVESWPEFGPSWAERVHNRYQDFYKEMWYMMKRDDSTFNVLCHGDFGIHNLMFRHSEPSGKVEAVMLVDFQTCCYNSPVLDLHQFIFGCANDDVLANHIHTLLKEYHTELTTTLQALGAPLEHTISLSQLIDEFNKKMPYGFYYATSIRPIMLLDISTNSNFTSEDLFHKSDDDVDKMQSVITDSIYQSFKILLPMFSNQKIL